MKIFKKSISILLIFLMLLTSCTTTTLIKKEEIESEKKILVTTNSEKEYQIITEKVTEDTLYGRIAKPDKSIMYQQYSPGDTLSNNYIAIAVKNIKSIEIKEINTAAVLILLVGVPVLIIVVALSFSDWERQPSRD